MWFLKTSNFSLAITVKTAAIQSHVVVQNNTYSLKGTIVVSNCDKNSASQSKDTLSNQLTQKVQTDKQNCNSTVKVNTITELPDGTLSLDYDCNNVADQNTAKNTLNTAVQQDDVKKIIGSWSNKNAPSTVRSEQQTTNQPGEFYSSIEPNFESVSRYIKHDFHQVVSSFKLFSLIYRAVLLLLFQFKEYHYCFLLLIFSYKTNRTNEETSPTVGSRLIRYFESKQNSVRLRTS